MDMSIESCAKRYEKKRRAILSAIDSGLVSASMSGIEYYPSDRFRELHDDTVIRVNLTWDGENHIDRPNWKSEFLEYAAKMDGPAVVNRGSDGSIHISGGTFNSCEELSSFINGALKLEEKP